MRHSLTVVFLLGVGALAFADDAKKEMEKLKGTWTVVSAERQGEANQRPVGDKLVFDGENVTIKRPNRDDRATYRIDPTKKPKQIEIVPKEGERKDQAHPGIYEFEGENLKICFTQPGQDRPKEFSTSKDQPQTMCVVLKRDK